MQELFIGFMLVIFPLFIVLNFKFSKSNKEIYCLYKVNRINGLKKEWRSFGVSHTGRPSVIWSSTSKISLTEKGLYVEDIFPFSIVFKPYLIPWKDLEISGKQFFYWRLRVTKIDGVYMFFPKWVVKRMPLTKEKMDRSIL